MNTFPDRPDATHTLRIYNDNGGYTVIMTGARPDGPLIKHQGELVIGVGFGLTAADALMSLVMSLGARP